MRTVLLNLPHPTRVVRRYTCSYNAPNFLFPPLELMYLGGIIKRWKRGEVLLLDAIAERMDLITVIKCIESYRPDILIFLCGIETFTEDMYTIRQIKEAMSFFTIVCIGYLPSIFPEEVLRNGDYIDYIIINEPEISFSYLYDFLDSKREFVSIQGVAGRLNGDIFIGAERERIKDLNVLPFPERSLIKMNLYNEFFLPKPFTTMQTARGCPFRCNYCVRTYGKEIIYRSIDNVIEEIKDVVYKYNVKTIRFMDDTFIISKKRIVDFCDSLLGEDINVNWTCLTRLDSLDNQLLQLMKRSGCVRIYIGIESGSQKLLDSYEKGYDIEVIEKQISLVNKFGIEALGFFMCGGPEETKDDFSKSIALVKSLDLDYIAVFKTTLYPGTTLYERHRTDIEYSLFPYVNCLKDRLQEERACRWEKKFYRSFYFRPRRFKKLFKNFISYPRETYIGCKKLLHYLVCPRQD